MFSYWFFQYFVGNKKGKKKKNNIGTQWRNHSRNAFRWPIKCCEMICFITYIDSILHSIVYVENEYMGFEWILSVKLSMKQRLKEVISDQIVNKPIISITHSIRFLRLAFVNEQRNSYWKNIHWINKYLLYQNKSKSIEMHII